MTKRKFFYLRKKEFFSAFAKEAEQATVYKKKHYLKMCMYTPWFLMVYGIIRIMAKLSGKKEKWYKIFILYFFEHYFKNRGMHTLIEVDSMEKILKETEAVIFTPRYNAFYSLYVYVKFKGEIIVPLDPIFYQYTFIGFKKWAAFKPLFESLTYKDQGLKQNYTYILKCLLEKKKILVYLNEGHIDPFYRRTLMIREECVMLYQKFKGFFLWMEGFEFFPVAYKENPYIVTQRLKSVNELWNTSPAGILSELKTICAFFNFSHMMLKPHESE